MGYSNHDDDHKSSNEVNQDHDDHGDDVQDNGKESHCLIIDNSICIDIASFLSDIDDQSLQNSPVLVVDDVAEVVNPSTLHPQSSGEKKRKLDSTNGPADNPAANNLKAINFPILSLQIGPWKRHARHDDELVARCYFSRKTLAWEILDGHLKFKFEILFSDIDAIKSYIIQDKGFLIIRLKNRPTFFREGKSKPRKHTKWEKCTDFTNQVATKTRVHELEFTRRVLEKHYSNIVQSNSDLFKLSTVEFPHHESHFFDDVRPKPYINQIGLQTEFPSNFRVPQQPLPVQGHLIYDGTKFSLPCTTSGSSFQDHNIGNFADDGYRGTNDIDSFTVDQGGSRYFRDHTGRLFGIPSSASSLSRLNDEWPPLTYPQVNPPTAMNHAMIPCAASARQRWLNEYTYTSSIPRSVTSPMSILNNGDFQTQTQNQNQNQTVLRNMQQNGHSNNEQRNQRANNQDGATNHAMIPSTAGAQHHCWMNGHTYDTSIPRFDISPTMPVLNNMDIQTQTQTQTRDHDRLLEDDSAVTSVDGRRLRLRNMQQNGHINSNQQQNQRPN